MCYLLKDSGKKKKRVTEFKSFNCYYQLWVEMIKEDSVVYCRERGSIIDLNECVQNTGVLGTT